MAIYEEIADSTKGLDKIVMAVQEAAFLHYCGFILRTDICMELSEKAFQRTSQTQKTLLPIKKASNGALAQNTFCSKRFELLSQ